MKVRNLIFIVQVTHIIVEVSLKITFHLIRPVSNSSERIFAMNRDLNFVEENPSVYVLVDSVEANPNRLGLENAPFECVEASVFW